MNIFKYSTQSPEQVMQELQTSMQGLSADEAKKRREQYGYNEFESKVVHWYQLLLRQLQSPFIYLLIAAAGIAFFITHDYLEGGMLLLIVVVNTGLGFYQEFKASQALALLRTFIVSQEKVVRNGEIKLVPTRELVPGDIVQVESGDKIPADMRIISSSGLTTDESILTGESVPVAKSNKTLSQKPKQLYQAEDLIFAGTSVNSGKATGVVVAIGHDMALGDIAQLTTETVRESSFSKDMGRFSKFILRMVIATMVAILLANIFIKQRAIDADLIIFSIALVVAIIPELLPTVITFSLSQGAIKLARHKVVVKRLSAIEDLGSIEILCTDKTGTLTENQMTVAGILAPDEQKALFHASLLANATSLKNKKSASSAFDEALWNYLSPELKDQAKGYEQIDEVPFEPARRRSSVLLKKGDELVLLVRGAYEEIEKLSNNIDPKMKDEIARWVAQEGQSGHRVIAIARRYIKPDEAKDLKKAEYDLTYQGIISFVDPIKKSSYEAIKNAKALGLQIKILTGDSPEVAGAVGYEVGLASSMQEVITGEIFDGLSDGEKKNAALQYAIFARISPRQKYEIIQLLQEEYDVGYLGDGINDAPALKLANVAIVVQGAADIAQDAADIVLLKKSLSVIVDGIKEGRKTFTNTTKYIKAVLSGNFGNFYTVALLSLILDYLPVLPLQVLLVNVITDLPMLTIATDNVDPRELHEPKAYHVKDIALMAILLGLVSTVFDFIFFSMFLKKSPAVMQSNWFILSVVEQCFLIFLIRTRLSIFRAERPSWQLSLALLATACVALTIPMTQAGHRIFSFVSPTLGDLSIVLPICIGYFISSEYVKVMYYWFMRKRRTTIAQ